MCKEINHASANQNQITTAKYNYSFNCASLMWQIATNNCGVLLMVREILVHRSETINYIHLVYGTLTFTVTLCMFDHLVSTDSLPILWRALLLTPADECLTSTEIKCYHVRAIIWYQNAKTSWEVHTKRLKTSMERKTSWKVYACRILEKSHFPLSRRKGSNTKEQAKKIVSFI